MQFDIDKLNSKNDSKKRLIEFNQTLSDAEVCDLDPTHAGDITWIDKDDVNKSAYLCVQDFQDFFEGNLAEATSRMIVLKALTTAGKDYFTKKGIQEFDKRAEIEEAKKVTEIKTTSPPTVDVTLIDTLSNKPYYYKFVEYMEEKIAIPVQHYPKLFSEWAESSLGDNRKKISREMNNMLDNILKIGEIISIDISQPNDAQYTEFIKSLGKSTAHPKFLIHKSRFLSAYALWVAKIPTTIGGGTTIILGAETIKGTEPTSKKLSKKEEWKKKPFDEEVIFDTRDFPSLEDIYDFSEQCYQYFTWKGVFLEQKFVRKLLLTIKKDKSFVLYGEPGDGKSMVVKNLLNFITQIYNGGLYLNDPDPKKQADLLEERASYEAEFHPQTDPKWKTPLNPKLKGKISEVGISWDSKNIDESTNPLTLYGGYAPESLSSGSKEKRRENLEFGIITDCIYNGKYCFLDELNRTENEVLGRMMGFLEEPYNYKIDEGNIRVILKDPSKKGKGRANWFIIGTMNIGDVGNFKMSSAFKRRYKIIQIHYDTATIVEIVLKARGYKDGIEKRKIVNDLMFICQPLQYETIQNLGDQFITQMETMISEVTKELYDRTHIWSNTDNLTQYGVGVAHCIAVLDDLALFFYSLFKQEKNYKKGNYLKDTTASTGFYAQIESIVKDIIWENVIMSLVDENDKFKLSQMKVPIETLIRNVTMHVEKPWQYVAERLNGAALNMNLDNKGFLDFLRSAWKFGRKD